MSSPVPVSPPVKRGPGRPPKRVHFNFMPKEAPFSSTLSPATTVPQPVKNVVPPTIMSPSLKSTQPPSVSSPLSLTRPCRVRFATKQYDASTGKLNWTSRYHIWYPELGGYVETLLDLFNIILMFLYHICYRDIQHELISFVNKWEDFFNWWEYLPEYCFDKICL